MLHPLTNNLNEFTEKLHLKKCWTFKKTSFYRKFKINKAIIDDIAGVLSAEIDWVYKLGR